MDVRNYRPDSVYRPDAVYPVVKDRLHMAKSYKYKQCDTMCAKIVLGYAQGRCRKCGGVGERHHIFLRSQHGNNWTVMFELPFQISLCDKCHKWGSKSAHRDPEGFFIWLQDYLLRIHQEERWQRIAFVRKHGLEDTRDRNEIYHGLIVALEEMEAVAWMDGDIDTEYGWTG